jgi:hypothetical protein
MSETLARFQASNAWDTRYALPLVPIHNNPWIYSAYALKIMRASGLTSSEEMQLLYHFESYASGCRIEPGLFNRWPDGTGGVTSHDELMGMAYVSSDFACELLAFLQKTDGVYCNKREELDSSDSERFNVFRFVFLEPFLRARAGYRVGLFSQLQFSAHVVRDMCSRRPDDTSDAGGLARLWLMLDTMEKYPIPGIAIYFWRKRMKTIGWSPKRVFQNYLSECPIYRQEVSDEF